MSQGLELRGISVAYDGIPAVTSVDLAVAPGRVRALVGANGAGKSTLMRAIMGLEPVTGGAILLDGEPMTGRPVEARVGRGLGYCPEGRRVFPALTVRENLEVAAAVTSSERRRRIERTLALFPQLGAKLDGLGWQLSGGQQQMLAIGRALMSEPRFLLLDEPTLGLAGAIIDEVLERLKDVVAGGTGILLAAQNTPAALAIADTVTVLKAGRTVWAGAVEEADDAVLRKAFLGG